MGINADPEYEPKITGTINTNGASVDLSSPNGSSLGLQLSGTWVGTLIVEASQDGTTYTTLSILTTPSRSSVSSLTANGLYVIDTNTYINVRIKATAWTSGTVTITAFGSDAASVMALGSALTVSSQIPASQFNGKALDADRLISGALMVEMPTDDVFVEFDTQIPSHLVTLTQINSGTVTQSNAQALVSSGTNTSGEASMTTRQIVSYRAGHESRVDFTAGFSAPIANAIQYIGIFDANNGFFIGYNGTTFNIGRRSAGSDTLTARASWNGDPLDGTVSSVFTSGGNPVAIDFTKGNVYRIRFQWLGHAVVWFEALSPDGEWVRFHSIRYPNSSTTPHIQSPNLPLRSHVKKTTAGASVVSIFTSSWRGTSFSSQYVDKVSVVNSTTTALGSNATFTGSFESVSDYTSVGIFFNADQDGVLTVNYSDDGTTVRDTYSYTINTTNFSSRRGALSLVPKWSFVQLVWVNGTSAQSTFALSTVLNRDTTSPEQTPISQVPTAQSLGIITQSVIVGKTTAGGGAFVPVKVNPSGAVQVDGSSNVQPIIDVANTSGVYKNLSVTSTPTEVKVGGSRLASRKFLTIQPQDGDLWYGFDTSVTSSNGTKIFKNSTQPLSFGDAVAVYVVTSGGTVNARITEGS